MFQGTEFERQTNEISKVLNAVWLEKKKENLEVFLDSSRFKIFML
jgi:hypothetical protein